MHTSTMQLLLIIVNKHIRTLQTLCVQIHQFVHQPTHLRVREQRLQDGVPRSTLLPQLLAAQTRAATRVGSERTNDTLTVAVSPQFSFASERSWEATLTERSLTEFEAIAPDDYASGDPIATRVALLLRPLQRVHRRRRQRELQRERLATDSRRALGSRSNCEHHCGGALGRPHWREFCRCRCRTAAFCGHRRQSHKPQAHIFNTNAWFPVDANNASVVKHFF